MNIETIKQTINNSRPDDWSCNERMEGTSFVYKQDVDLRIELDTMDFNYPFNEKWATVFEDPNAYKYKYTVYYNKSVIFEKYLVSVDGGHATLPMPKSSTELVISRADYVFAGIVNYGNLDNVDTYLHRAGIRVD